MLILIKTC
ncbi:hypothetical protein CP8484711_2130A, partial [Chlamydia psittaci 84-8471/1]